ncbi:MAG: hypothetical protein ACI3XR_10035 [Eubacteriales bacterium]
MKQPNFSTLRRDQIPGFVREGARPEKQIRIAAQLCATTPKQIRIILKEYESK